MNIVDNFLKKYFNKIFWILSCMILALYLLPIGGKGIWKDEAYTFGMVRHSFSDIWRITGADVHPPLYYWYLKILIAPFNYNAIAAKIASILPYMFIIVWGGKQLSKYFNHRTAILFMVIFFFFPFAQNYSSEIRMYSLAAAFVFGCAVYAYKFWMEHGEIKDIVGLVAFGVLAAYTHYFAFVAICIIYGLLFIAILLQNRNLIRKWLISVAVSIILYIPWLPSFVGQLHTVSNDYWIDKITLATIHYYWKSLFGAGAFDSFYLFFPLPYLICLIWIVARKNKNDIILCICCLLIPVGTLTVGVLASIIVRPVFLIRYIVPTIPLLTTFMAIVLGKVNNSFLFSSIVTIVLMGGMSNYKNVLCEYVGLCNYVPVDEYDDVDAYVVLDDTGDSTASILGYYVTETSIYWGDKISDNNPFSNRVSMDDLDTDNIDKAIILSNGEKIPDKYYNLYDIEYIGQWRISEDLEAYVLTKKQDM